MPNLPISLEKTAEFYGARQFKAFAQHQLTSIYQKISDDETYKDGVCAGLVYTLACHPDPNPFSFLEKLDGTINTLARDFYDNITELNAERRLEIVHSTDKIKLILENQQLFGPIERYWEKHSSPSPFYCLRRVNDAQTHTKIMQQLQLALISAIDGYISITYRASCETSGTVSLHNIALRCFFNDGKLNFMYFDPNEGMIIWDDPSKFFEFLDVWLQGIILKTNQVNFEQKLTLSSKTSLASAESSFNISAYGKDKTPWSLSVTEKLQAILKEDTQKATLDKFFSQMNVALYLELYRKNRVLLKQILSELPQFRSNLINQFIYGSLLENTEPSDYIKSILSVDDCQPLIELLLLEEGKEHLGSFLNIFEADPQKLSYLFQDARVLELIGPQKTLIFESTEVHNAFAKCAVTYPELKDVDVCSSMSFIRSAISQGITLKAPLGLSYSAPIDKSPRETARSFLKSRYSRPAEAGRPVEAGTFLSSVIPGASLLSTNGLFAAGAITAVALAACYGISKMRQ